jgi:hypothetical protein
MPVSLPTEASTLSADGFVRPPSSPQQRAQMLRDADRMPDERVL